MPSDRIYQIEDFSSVFDAIQKSGLNLVLVGGQACNFYSDKFLGLSPIIKTLYPLTSKDIDYHGQVGDGEKLAKHLKGEFIPSPRKGTFVCLGKVVFDGKEIEILRTVRGLSEDVVSKAYLSLDYKGFQVRVLHPVPLYEAKAANLVTLDQTNRQDEKHLRAMEAVLPEYFKETAKNPQNERELLNSFKRLYDFSFSTEGKTLAKQGRISSVDLIPRFKAPSEKIMIWQEKQRPQWEAKLLKKGLRKKGSSRI